jgi:LytS/YehU family sensor histidine kinase
LLVVLIENAFKFVSSFSDKENKINIKISTLKNVLYCLISNTTESQQAHSGDNNKGIGVANLKRRLTLLYPKKHELTTNIEDNFYQTNLIIDLA